MNLIINEALDKINKRGFSARTIDIKRAYWRHWKQRNGFNLGRELQTDIITDYLIFNRLAKPAYKFQNYQTPKK